MVYTPTYVQTDIQPAFIDLLGAFIAGFASFASLIVLGLVISLVAIGFARAIGSLMSMLGHHR